MKNATQVVSVQLPVRDATTQLLAEMDKVARVFNGHVGATVNGTVHKVVIRSYTHIPTVTKAEKCEAAMHRLFKERDVKGAQITLGTFTSES